MEVTFLIPTLGRYSIHQALGSLRDQTNPNWKAIVVFDNHDITINTDEKVSAYRFDKPLGQGPGMVRNYAFPFVDTDWIAFLDDDDYLDKTYVDRIFHYAKANYDLINFTYRDVNSGNTQPSPGMKIPQYCHIGMSVAVRTSFIKDNNIQFIPGSCEDWFFIEDCIQAGAKYILTGEILYFVGKRSGWR